VAVVLGGGGWRHWLDGDGRRWQLAAGGGGAKRRLRRRTGAVRVQTLTVTLYRPPASEWADWASWRIARLVGPHT
jgi:hypothetical protein